MLHPLLQNSGRPGKKSIFFYYFTTMDTTDYKRIFHLIALRNKGTETLAEHEELDNWLYGNTECPRIMFELFIDPQYADALEEIAQSLRP